MKLYLFTKGKMDPPRAPNRPGLVSRHVPFESTKFDDLLLVAKFRVVNYPMSVLVNDRDQVLMKVKGPISDKLIDGVEI